MLAGALLCIVLITSCRFINPNKDIKRPDETPTRGNITITVDESFQPLLETEIFTFTSIYNNAHITAQYKPEYDVITDYLNDSVKLIVTSRKLTDNQIQYLRESLIVPRTITFAYDALALVTHKDNLDTLIAYNTVRNIFQGNITNWNQINPKSNLGNVRVIFDNNRSGNIRYFRELFEITETLPSNFYAVQTNPEVIEFVSNNRDAIGIVSVNWISDRHDSLTMSFMNKVNVLAVSNQFLSDRTFYRPYQGSIVDKSYPFVREVNFISRETFAGLGTGFVQWVTAEQGQRIILKSGLVPATMPIRLVEVKN
jgi:phosphate transport system substrate-binding protein